MYIFIIQKYTFCIGITKPLTWLKVLFVVPFYLGLLDKILFYPFILGFWSDDVRSSFS